MKREVLIGLEAELDLLDAHSWYESQQPGLGRQFREAVDAQLARVAERPLQFARVSGEVRRVVLNRFPFVLYFTLEEHVHVIACVHTARDPDFHLERLPGS